MSFSIDLNKYASNFKGSDFTVDSILRPHFDPSERAKALEYIDNGRIEIHEDSESILFASVEGNARTYFLDFFFDHIDSITGLRLEPRKFVLRASCTCPAFEKRGVCKHIWAFAQESRDSDFYSNFSKVMKNNFLAHKVKELKSQPRLRWEKFIPKAKQNINDTLGQHEVLQKNLINKPTPRKYFLVLQKSHDQLKRPHRLQVVYRSVRKAGDLGSIQDTYISEERLKEYPDPNFNIVFKEIFNISSRESRLSYQDYADFEYHQGYGYYSSNSIVSLAISPTSIRLLRLSSALGRLVIERESKTSHYSQTELDPLCCNEKTWVLRYELLTGTSGFELKAYVAESDNLSNRLVIDSDKWELNVISHTILKSNEILFLLQVPLPELANELVNLENKVEFSREELNDFLIALANNELLGHFDIADMFLANLTRKAPKPILMLERPGKNSENPMDFCGLLAFDYDSEFITPNDQRSWLPSLETMLDGRTKIIERDFDWEREVLAPLSEVIHGLSCSDIHNMAAVSIPTPILFNLIEKLLVAGWEVRLAKQVIKKSSSNSVSVSSGIDWFEIASEIEFDGEVVQIDKLILAAKERQNFVTFNNGSGLGMLPPDLVRRISTLAQLGTIKDGKIRLNTNQAMWIDLLLRDEIADKKDLDERIKSGLQNLSDLQGIKPSLPSKTFEGSLRDYQKFGLGWLKTIMLSGFGACLADDMGLGKTIQILALLDSVLDKQSKNDGKSYNEPCLIVAPKTLIENWLRECQKFTPRLKAVAYHGQSRKELKDNLESYDIILTTYATLSRDIVELRESQFSFVILDEAQSIKNSSSLAAKSCLLLKAKYRLALTGTPIENSLDDLLSIFEFLNPGMLGQMARKRSELAKINGMSDNSMHYIAKGLLPFILRRTKSEVLKELPPKTEQVLYCELTPKQQKLYDKTKEHYKASLSKEISEKGMLSVKMQFLEALLRLRQICCDPRLIDPKLKFEDSAKLVTLLDELEELRAAGKKALIFSQFTGFLSFVGDALKARNIEYDYLDGKTNNRQKLVDSFQNYQGSRFFLISIKAGGVGLNLTTADYCFILDPWWNPAVEAQAIDRAHRIGQVNPVFAYKLIAKNSVEEKIIALQHDKKELAALFTSENTGFIKNLSIKDFEMIFD